MGSLWERVRAAVAPDPEGVIERLGLTWPQLWRTLVRTVVVVGGTFYAVGQLGCWGLLLFPVLVLVSIALQEGIALLSSRRGPSPDPDES